MPYVIGEPCIDVMDRSCIEECPVDCIYEGGRKLYINLAECIDCGACEPACPVEAISQDRKIEPDQEQFVTDNKRFFTDPLRGSAEALGEPGGAMVVGPIGVDTELVAGYVPRG
ncbi:4Fe-4S binding domain-containing protein [Haloechinothrix alba]|uniref:Ferredoxin n=1 Tax=Haloechinothrix alba TaxID=664784 RepID=A0A238W8L1_9PSEU|nr:ferredoxin [Haloechinothrix alba]SNR42916.1 4Fe-4S binding domain-containing protein [Haloechinothrix alba]